MRECVRGADERPFGFLMLSGQGGQPWAAVVVWASARATIPHHPEKRGVFSGLGR